MANENSAIWQVASGASDGTEATALAASEVILFNSNPIITSTGYIFNSKYIMRNSVPENESVASNNNEVQDMGLDGVDIIITGTFLDADSNASVDRFIAWMKEAKNGSTVVGYEKGRFGIRMNDFPQFNVVPDGNGVAGGNTYGYVLASIEFTRDGTMKNRAGFVATLRLSGDLDSAI